MHSPLHNAALSILWRYYASLEPHAYVGDDTCLDAIFKPRRVEENAFEVDVTKDHCNGLGGLHGRAACILAEHAAGDGGLAAMHVSLMRGLSGRASLEFLSDAAAKPIADASGRPPLRGACLAGELDASRLRRGTRLSCLIVYLCSRLEPLAGWVPGARFSIAPTLSGHSCYGATTRGRAGNC